MRNDGINLVRIANKLVKAQNLLYPGRDFVVEKIDIAENFPGLPAGIVPLGEGYTIVNGDVICEGFNVVGVQEAKAHHLVEVVNSAEREKHFCPHGVAC